MHESCLAQTQRQKHSKKKRLAHKTYTQKEVTLTHTKYGQPNFRVLTILGNILQEIPGFASQSSLHWKQVIQREIFGIIQ